MNTVTDAIGDLSKQLNETKNKQKVIFADYILPFFEKAKIVCDDAMIFYRNFAVVAKELANSKYRDEKKFVEYISERRPAIEQMRNKLLNERIHLEKMGAVLRNAKWFDDLSLQNAIDEMVKDVLFIVREYDGVGSRPKTLLDGLNVLELAKTSPELFAITGGLLPLVEEAERNWSEACTLYEQVRAYISHGIRPTSWGGVIGPNTYKYPSIWSRIGHSALKVFKVAILILAVAFAILGAFETVQNIINSKFQSVTKEITK